MSLEKSKSKAAIGRNISVEESAGKQKKTSGSNSAKRSSKVRR